VPQHYPVPDIQFEGSVVDPAYPEPTSFTLGNFEGRIEFLDENRTIHEAIQFTGKDFDASECRGVERWSQCIPGFTLGELDTVQQRNQQLQSEVQLWKTLAIGLGITTAAVLLLLLRSIGLFGVVYTVRPVKTENMHHIDGGTGENQ